MEPQLKQVIIEAWRNVVDVDRSKQVKKVTDITCILQTSVKFRDFCEAVSLLAFNKSLSKLAILLILANFKAPFSVVWTDFP